LVVFVVVALPMSSRMALAASGAKGHVRKGGLASVTLEATPSPALGGRLVVALLRTAEDIPRAESIMAAEASPENEDRFVADFGKLRVVVLVRDTFALAPATPGEFAVAALQQARADGLDTGAPAAIEPLDLPAPLRAVKLVPSRLHCREGGCLAGAAFVAGADRLCEVVAIFVSPNAAKDAAGARAILGSVRSGGCAADLQGHKRQLGVLFHDEKLFAEVPASSMLSADTGPDFSVYHVWLLEPARSGPAFWPDSALTALTAAWAFQTDDFGRAVRGIERGNPGLNLLCSHPKLVIRSGAFRGPLLGLESASFEPPSTT
jgi:hypothetical protein